MFTTLAENFSFYSFYKAMTTSFMTTTVSSLHMNFQIVKFKDVKYAHISNHVSQFTCSAHTVTYSLPSVSYALLLTILGSTISHLLSLLQPVTLLACSLDARPCMPAVALYYCTFQGTVQFSSVQSCLTFCDPMDYSMPGFPVLHSQGFLKLTSIELVKLSIHFILCCPLLLLPSIFPSIRVFSNKSTLHIRWSKYWNFSISISSSNEYIPLPISSALAPLKYLEQLYLMHIS